MQRIGWGQTELSKNWAYCKLHRQYLSAFSAASQILFLKPHLGGSSDSQIELVWTSFHTLHDFAFK